VIEREQLFLPALYRAVGIEGEQGFEQHPSGARNHLLPLSPIVLALMDGRSLSRSCQLAATGSGAATVSLRIRFENGNWATLTRHYAAEDGSEPPFALSIWPNFRASWWRLHLAYSSATPDLQFVTTGLVSLEGLNRFPSGQDGLSVGGRITVRSAQTLGSLLVSGRIAADTPFRRDEELTSYLRGPIASCLASQAKLGSAWDRHRDRQRPRRQRSPQPISPSRTASPHGAAHRSTA
jgi:hypothetical protein